MRRPLFAPRAVHVADLGRCAGCGVDLLEVVELRAGAGGGLSFRLARVLMCGCGVRREETCAAGTPAVA